MSKGARALVRGLQPQSCVTKTSNSIDDQDYLSRPNGGSCYSLLMMTSGGF